MDTSAEPANRTAIHPDTHIGVVALTVSDLQRSMQFYEQVIGFRPLDRAEHSGVLGAEGLPLLLLMELPGAQPKPIHSTGLYHFAILVPGRADLGRFLQHLIDVGYPLGGHSDHLVSEALYLSDPDGNGIEVYRDRPRSEWTWQQGQVRMAVDPLDLRGLLAEAAHEQRVWAGLPAGTTIGHIHLQVADIREAEAFYHNILGFDVVLNMGSALFISAGGYHHHLGLNIWNSRRGPQPPPDSAGLQFFTVNLPNQAAQAEVVTRLEAARIPFERRSHAVVLHDPWQNGIWLTVEPDFETLPLSEVRALVEREQP